MKNILAISMGSVLVIIPAPPAGIPIKVLALDPVQEFHLSYQPLSRRGLRSFTLSCCYIGGDGGRGSTALSFYHLPEASARQ